MEFSIFTDDGETIYNKIGRQKNYYGEFVFQLCQHLTNYQTDTIALPQIKNPLGMKQRNYSNLIKKMIKIGLIKASCNKYRFYTTDRNVKPKPKSYEINRKLINIFINFYNALKHKKAELTAQKNDRLPQKREESLPTQTPPKIQLLVEKIMERNKQNDRHTLDAIITALDKKYRLQFLIELKRQKEQSDTESEFEIL